MIIDLWDTATLPQHARQFLFRNDELLREYKADEDRITAELPEHGPRIRRRNNFRCAKEDLEGTFAEMVAEHDIRCFHYSRMIDEEVEALKETGIVVTSLNFLRERLDRLVGLGHMDQAVADMVHLGSALSDDIQYGRRNGMFWVCATPIETGDGCVTMLLGSWGGESTYWTVEDRAIAEVLKTIGRSRIIELAVPMQVALHSGPSEIARRFVDLRMNQLGLTKKDIATDFYLERNLPPDAVLAVHTRGEDRFDTMAQGYPASFVPLKWDENQPE
jgi:hypothetical protein